MKTRRLLVTLLSGLSLFSCRKDSTGSSLASEVSLPVGGAQKTLFAGYDDRSKTLTNRVCIMPAFAMNEEGAIKPEYLLPHVYATLRDNDVRAYVDAANAAAGSDHTNTPLIQASHQSSDQEATIEFIKDASAATLMDRVAGGINVNMAFADGASVSGGASVALDSGSSSRSTNLAYIAKLKAKSVQIDPRFADGKWRLTKYGKLVQRKIAEMSDATPAQKEAYLKEFCGTHYVDQINLGAMFVATMKVGSQLESDRDYISSNLKVDLKASSGSSNVCIDKSKIASNINVKLRVYQQGGSPVQLASLLADRGGHSPTGAAALALTESELPSEDKCNKDSDAPAVAESPVDGANTVDKLISCDVSNINRCFDIFSKIVSNASDSDKVGELKPGGGEVKGEVLGRYFGGQLNEASIAGLAVIGYGAHNYTLHDFRVANMFGDNPDHVEELAAQPESDSQPSVEPTAQPSIEPTVQPIAAPSPAAESVPQGANSQPPSVSIESSQALKPTPPDVVYKQRALEQHFLDHVNVYAYAKDANSLISGLISSLEVSWVMASLLEEMGEIQKGFRVCTEQPEACGQILERFNERLARDNRIQQHVGKVERIIAEQIGQDGFLGYCHLTSIARFRDPPNTAWRNSMWVIARQLGPDLTIDGQDIRVWQIPEGDEGGYRPKIDQFCAALAQRTNQALRLSLKDPEGSSIALLAEPLTHFTSLDTLDIDLTNLQSTNSFVTTPAMPTLGSLTVHHANLLNPLVIGAMTTLHTLVLYYQEFGETLESGSERARIATGIRNFLKNMSTRILQVRVSPEIETPIEVDLANFRDAFKNGFLGQAGRLLQLVEIQDSSKVQLTGTEAFFGYDENINVGQCRQSHTTREVLFWIGADLRLNISNDDHLAKSYCCEQVKARCATLKNAKRWTDLKCDVACLGL